MISYFHLNANFMRNVNLLKCLVSEISVNQIHVNQGVGVFTNYKLKLGYCEKATKFELSSP
jgi:hypothetical protein